MTDGLGNIITQLESQKAAIDKALAALREIEGSETAALATPVAERQAPSEPATRKGGMSPEGKARLVAALKKRWAAKKRAAKKAASATVPVESAPAVSQPAVKRKPTFTPEGRRRLAEAMKKRWAVKRAASAVKKSSGKRAA